MDPNNQNPQVDNPAINKLEQDLKDLSQQTSTVSQTPVPVEQPIPPTPEIPETPPVMTNAPTPPAASVETNIPVGEKPKKGSPILIVAIILALVAVLAVVAYIFGAKLLSQSPKQTACTLEAKICPDGSSVGRTGPNCEFTACPIATPDPTVNWKTYTNTKFNYQVKYPNVWNVNRGPGNISDSQLAMSRNVAIDGPNTALPGVVFNVDTNELDAEGQVKNCTSLEDCISKISAGFPAYDSKQAEIETIKFLGQDSETIIYTRTTDSYRQKWVHQFVIMNDNLYHFSFYSAEVDYPTYRPTFDQILSTFKFIEATPAASPVATTSEIPADLVTVVKQNAADQSNPKVTADKVIIGQSQVEENYASVAFNYVDGGGAIFWLTKTGGIWKVVAGGQEPPKCSLLKSFNFPADFSCNP